MKLKKVLKHIDYLNTFVLIKSGYDENNNYKEVELFKGYKGEIPEKYMNYKLDNNDYGTGEDYSIYTHPFVNKHGVNVCEIRIYITK